jgi:biopolymer transport protein ExbB
MNLAPILDFVGNVIYGLQAWTALHGIFLVIMLLRRIRQKRFATEAGAQAFVEEVQTHLTARKFDEAAQVCDSPPYWSKAVPQLLLLALQQRDRPLPKIKALLADRFESDVLADLDYRMAWLNTIVKTAPMLGLQGTVVGMIAAFAKIAAASQTGIDPAMLANDISFALWTTAIGLMIAIPLVMAGAAIQVRIAKLQDGVQRHLGTLIETLDAVLTAQRKRPS